ncbi:hypothetical protein WR25_04221 [Diploscapter pachys]|uniref:Phospholipid scramblase n=1 Tax=Diploscapter pachys TaxID=2018661 RepID=A0A2A2K1F0_9BILA|nr:hypothetical protein WR25_04221 [Diploscapter pachys]
MVGSAMPINVQPGAVVVPVPMPMDGVPVGLEYLTMVNTIMVHQRIEAIEILIGFETKNRYVLRNANGDQVYFAYEESECFERICCGPQRSWTMHIIDNFKREVITIRRPFKCCGGGCNGLCAGADCCAQECEIFTAQGPVAYVKQLSNGCDPMYELRDPEDKYKLIISGPCCCIFATCQDKEFEIKTEEGIPIGSITKKWGGICRESFTDADVFSVTFPIDLSVKTKAALIGLTFLIDFMYFEHQNNN